MTLLLIMMSTTFEIARAVHGYNCDNQLINVTTVSLVDVVDCDIKPPKLNITT